jgi:hypothetical protein
MRVSEQPLIPRSQDVILTTTHTATAFVRDGIVENDSRIEMTDEVKNDKLKLVADNDDMALSRHRENIASEIAASRLSHATRALAANILRIIAGAGKDYKLTSQMVEVLKAYQELHPFSGRACYSHTPSTPMTGGLRNLNWRKGAEGYYQPTDEDLAKREHDGSAAVDRAKEDIVQAALRLTAAQLMAQPTQESTADSQLMAAIRDFDQARDVRSARRRDVRSHLPFKKIGIYDALDEQNRLRSKAEKPKPE